MTKPTDLIDSAEVFDLETVDRNIGTWIRKFADGSEQDWIFSENSLMRILLDYALIPADDLEDPTGSSFEKVANTIARALGNCGRTAEYSTDYLVTLAALCFAAGGNFPSASVFANQAKKNSKKMGIAEKWMMEVLSSKKFTLKDTNPPPDFTIYCILMDEALHSGQDIDFEHAEQELERACKASLENIDRTDKFLLLFWKQIHKRFEQLSATRVLRKSGFQNQRFIEALRDETLMLYPSQVHTIQNFPLTQPGNEVIVSLPTSTGKSLLGEIALVSSLSWEHTRWLAVYLAPYRALTNQLQERMRKRLRKVGIACVIRHGGYLSDESILDSGRPTILIATPEAFDSLLRTKPELYSHLSACVFDEFHLIEQQERGLRYEGILGRFLSGAAGKGSPKIIALSAVIPNTDRITHWLQTPDENVSKLPWIPTSRKLAIVNPNGIIRYFCPGENIGHNNDDGVIWSGKVKLNHEIKTYPTNFPAQRVMSQQIVENVAATAVDQWKRFEKPILVLVNSRKQARLIAREISAMLDPQNDTEATTLATEISIRAPFLYTLQNCLAHQVAYHNAALPDWVRNKLEKLIQQRALKVLVATPTLAEGVDLPFRVVVLADWHQYQFGKPKAMSPLLFRNIAGRGGRAWEYIEGDTIIVDVPDEKLKEYPERYKNYIEQYIKQPTYGLKSSIYVESLPDQKITAEAKAVLESQFVAYVDVCDKSDGIESRFSNSLYASTDESTKEQVFGHVNEFTKDMLEEPVFPVLRKNSPLQLTDFGKVALQTGLSPKSAIALAKFLKSYHPIDELKAGKIKRSTYGIPWQSIVAALWEYRHEIQEISTLHTGYTKPRIKENDSLLVIMSWIAGIPIEVIAYLIFDGVSENRQAVKNWLLNQSETLPSNFEEDIDQIAVFCKQDLSEQWSWVLRGAAKISENIPESSVNANTLSDLALRFRYGVKHIATVKLLEHANCPVDRAKLDWLIGSFVPKTSIEFIDTKTFREWLSKGLHSLPQTSLFRDFPRLSVTEADITQLISFLENIREVTEN